MFYEIVSEYYAPLQILTPQKVGSPYVPTKWHPFLNKTRNMRAIPFLLTVELPSLKTEKERPENGYPPPISFFY